MDVSGSGNIFLGESYFIATGDVNLSSSTFGGATYFDGSGLTVDAQGDLELDGGTAANWMTFSVTGSISQTPYTSLRNSGNSIFFADGAVNINDPQNLLMGMIRADGTDITLVNRSLVALSTVNATGNLTVSGAGISQTASVTVRGDTRLNSQSQESTFWAPMISRGMCFSPATM